MVKSMYRELELRDDFFKNELINSIYFGGGSPSLLSSEIVDSELSTTALNVPRSLRVLIWFLPQEPPPITQIFLE